MVLSNMSFFYMFIQTRWYKLAFLAQQRMHFHLSIDS